MTQQPDANGPSRDDVPAGIPADVTAMLSRANRLGADPTVTNYGGGNTSCKVEITHAATGEPATLLYVKGSGGDLGTLRFGGLAVLELDRLRGLDGRYRGQAREDEMVELFPWCGYGPGGAAPSIDTPMHGLVDRPHIDHLHPDSVIALAASADGERLTAECYGGRVAWIPWIRPGWELGRLHRQLLEEHPELEGVVLGGHGLTCWGASSDECERRAFRLIREAAAFIERTGRPEPLGPARADRAPLDEAERLARAAALVPLLRRIASVDARMVGHYTDSQVVLDFLSREALDRLVPLGTSCPDHFLRTKVRPLLLDTAPDAPLEQVEDRLDELHRAYREEYRAYYERHAGPDSPPMRGADPAIVLVPGIGMFSFGKDKQTARVTGEFYVNAINVMRGAEAVSVYQPVDEAEKFRVEYWALEEAKLRRMPRPKPLAGRVAGIGRATCHALAAQGACVIVADLDLAGAEALAKELGGPRRGRGGRDGRGRRGGHHGRDRRRQPGLRRPRPGGQQRRPVQVGRPGGDHRPAVGPPAQRHAPRLVPGLPGGRPGDAPAGAGGPTGPACTASRRRTWASTTPSEHCSSARSCPSTWPRRCWP
jgi:rhamnulose-1-phosphate aldolase/alcohol dehydrogenase